MCKFISRIISVAILHQRQRDEGSMGSLQQIFASGRVVPVPVIVVKSDRRGAAADTSFVAHIAYGTGDKLLIIITFLPARIMMTDLFEANIADYADVRNMEMRG